MDPKLLEQLPFEAAFRKLGPIGGAAGGMGGMGPYAAILAGLASSTPANEGEDAAINKILASKMGPHEMVGPQPAEPTLADIAKLVDKLTAKPNRADAMQASLDKIKGSASKAGMDMPPAVVKETTAIVQPANETPAERMLRESKAGFMKSYETMQNQRDTEREKLPIKTQKSPKSLEELRALKTMLEE